MIPPLDGHTVAVTLMLPLPSGNLEASALRVSVHSVVEGEYIADAAVPYMLCRQLGALKEAASIIVHLTHTVLLRSKSGGEQRLVILGARQPRDGDKLALAPSDLAANARAEQLLGASAREEEKFMALNDLGVTLGKPFIRVVLQDLSLSTFSSGAGVRLVMELADKRDGCMRGVAFNAVAERLYTQFRCGDEVVINGGRVRRAKECFRCPRSTTPFELTLDDRTEVVSAPPN